LCIQSLAQFNFHTGDRRAIRLYEIGSRSCYSWGKRNVCGQRRIDGRPRYQSGAGTERCYGRQTMGVPPAPRENLRRLRRPARDRGRARIWGVRSLVVRAGCGNRERALVCGSRRRYLGTADHVHIGRRAANCRVGGAGIVCIWLIVRCRSRGFTQQAILARSCRQRLASAPTSGAWQPNAHAGVARAQLECSDNTVDMMDDAKSCHMPTAAKSMPACRRMTGQKKTEPADIPIKNNPKFETPPISNDL
jgi:hypothetical protein